MWPQQISPVRCKQTQEFKVQSGEFQVDVSVFRLVKMDLCTVLLLLALAAFVAFLFLADGDLSLVVIEKFGKKLGSIVT